MDKIRIVMCDDEETALHIISASVVSTFKKMDIPVEIIRFLRVDKMLLWLEKKENACHVIMLDIRMPQADGIILAGKLQELHPDARIVFVSNEEARVFEAFSVNAFFFIRKSHLIEDVSAFCGHYASSLNKDSGRKVISLRQNGADISLYPGEIVYVESEGRHQKIWQNGKKAPIEVNMSMQGLEEQLEGCGFIRVHKGYLVNNAFISRISGEAVVTKDGVQIPISRRKLQEVHEEHMRLTKLNNTMFR